MCDFKLIMWFTVLRRSGSRRSVTQTDGDQKVEALLETSETADSHSIKPPDCVTAVLITK